MICDLKHFPTTSLDADARRDEARQSVESRLPVDFDWNLAAVGVNAASDEAICWQQTVEVCSFVESCRGSGNNYAVEAAPLQSGVKSNDLKTHLITDLSSAVSVLYCFAYLVVILKNTVSTFPLHHHLLSVAVEAAQSKMNHAKLRQVRLRHTFLCVPCEPSDSF